MATTTVIDPVTRIEGHLGIKIEVDKGHVTEARCIGEMFRGFEVILKGRDPLDAQHITQRICGVCPIAHGTASILAQDEAYGINVPTNGRLLRNLVLGANYVQSHLLHFYHLAALDFVDIGAITDYQGKDSMLLIVKAWVLSQTESKTLYPVAPFLPREDGQYLQDPELNIVGLKHYLEAFEMRSLAHRMGAIFAGKMPHAACLIPGGITERPTAKKVAAFRDILQQLQRFITDCYLTDVIEVAKACPEYATVGKSYGNFMAYGAFPESDNNQNLFFPSGIVQNNRLTSLEPRFITEDVKYSRFSSESGVHPSQGVTQSDPHKTNAYSWIKSPRYNGHPMEVGPLARVLVAYYKGSNPELKRMVDGVLGQLNATPEALNSVLGRHAARAIECKLVADRCATWLNQIDIDGPVAVDFTVPEKAIGMGLTEAPRGALGHWINIENHKIKNYQCVVPTTWNCSPRDDQSKPGPVEKALEGTPVADTKHPIEALRVVRSFDPCLACAVH